MFTKSPDYIISEVGQPEWKHENNIINKFNSLNRYRNCNKPFSTITDTTTKLLPLRETLSQYYVRRIEFLKYDKYKRQLSNRFSEKIYENEHVKCQKNKYNECIKLQHQQQQVLSPLQGKQSKQKQRSNCIAYKCRFHHTSAIEVHKKTYYPLDANKF